jgi:hypothetical protein
MLLSKQSMFILDQVTSFLNRLITMVNSTVPKKCLKMPHLLLSLIEICKVMLLESSSLMMAILLNNLRLKLMSITISNWEARLLRNGLVTQTAFTIMERALTPSSLPMLKTSMEPTSPALPPWPIEQQLP